MTQLSATYSPDDNKLRLYASTRLDSETYTRVRAAGFIWAPKQDLFVAPMWTPAREDLLIELCDEIGDEDSSLVARAEERAERFVDYSEKRARESNRAQKAVAAICDGIPLGQPILIGHHSERHARKDAERIENGMRKAVKLWETAGYWKGRAAGAISAAKYKELPAVRARRIKGLEADKRKHAREIKDAETCLKIWRAIEKLGDDPAKQLETARAFTGRTQIGHLGVVRQEREGQTYVSYWSAYDVLLPDEASEGHSARYKACPALTVPQVLAKALTAYDSGIAFNRRWIAHIDNRLAYERAMLSEAGGTAADRFDIEPGGRVKLRGEWASVLRVNRSGGAITSVTTNARYGRVRGIDEVSDYQPPEAGEAEAVAAATKLGPLCNYSSESFISMSKAQWTKIPKDYKGFRKVAATTEAGPHRIRYAMGVFAARDAGAKIDDSKRHSYLPVYVTDEAQKAPPKPATIAAPPIPRPEPIARPVAPKPAESPKESPIASDVDAMRASLKAGVKVATVNQLFPTPSEIAAQMVEAAGIESGMRVLEPSAGTGVLARAADKAGANVTCVEIDQSLFRALAREFDRSFHVDFLVSNPAWFAAPFDRVIMNPPFANGDDIKHIRHAATMLRPGGRLVALCANGPRQQAELKPLASEWRDLPAGSFKAEGTGVNVAMLTIDA